MSELLLDTCAVLWLANGMEISSTAREAVSRRKLHVSPISAWEIATLVRKNRIAITLPVTPWFRRVADIMEARVPDLSIEVLVDSCSLPGSPPNDPADRIIIATARLADLTLVTRDKAILAYSRSGHVRTMEC